MKNVFQSAVITACAIAVYASQGVTDGGRFALKFAASGIGSNLEARFAADLPRRDAVLAAMRDGRKFLSTDAVSFTLLGEWGEDEGGESDIRLDVKVEDVFGLPPLRKESVLEKISSEVKDGVRRIRWRFALEDNPGCGLWRVVAKLRKSGDVACETNAAFEVLSDDLNGPCPPQFAKLPVLLASPCEAAPGGAVTGFDPFAWSVAAPYFAIGASAAAEGADMRVWDALAANARRWLCLGGGYGSDNSGANETDVAEYLRHAAYFQGHDTKRDIGFYDFTRPSCYRGAQLCILRDYIVERRPPLKLMSLAEINLRIGRKGALSREEFEEVFSTCWNDFLDFANRRRAALSHDFMDYLLSVNPAIARADVQSVALDRCRSPYSLLLASRIPDEDQRLRAGRSFFMLADSSAEISGVPSFRRMRRAAYFAAGYALNFQQSRLLYPELDCAAAPHIAAFRFAYGTQYFRGGEFGCWSDDGFHVRNARSWTAPEKFAKAWGETLRHPPMRSARAPYAVVDFDAFRRVGDELAVPYAGGGEPVAFNRADEAVGRVWEQCVESGRLPPVLTTLSEIERLMPDATDFVILPPLVDTPPAVLEAIREANLRGIAFLGLGRVDGLEDLFGVRAFSDGPRKFGPGKEGARPSVARYRADGAEVVASAESRDMGTTPVAFFRKASVRVGRLALASIPLGRAEMSDLISRLSPRPAIRTEKGTIMAAYDADGSLVVVLCADTSDFAEGLGELEFSFSVSTFGAARMSVRSDAWHEVVSREGDCVTVRTKAARGTAAVFYFSKNIL